MAPSSEPSSALSSALWAPLPVPLSVLDLAPISAGSSAQAALRSTVELAQQVESWGYHRFWVAEHHNMPGIASSAPAVLIGRIADATRSLRVGSGGVMLPNHPPLVVAEQFGMLENLHPGRIDLGLGRAPGTDPATAAALRRSVDPLSADDFPEQLGELIAFLTNAFPDGHRYASIGAVPHPQEMPPIWLLGSSGYSAQVAGLLGLPFAFAHHFSAANTLPALALYRSRFQPSTVLSEPYAMVAASVLVADTDERARELAMPSGLSFLRLRAGHPGPLPSPDEAASHRYSPREQQMLDERFATSVIGGPATVRRGLDDLLAATAANELMVTTMVHDPDDRLTSFRLLAELAGLTPAATASTLTGASA
jgi:luciferase family oxidoreductase group 1